MRIGLTGGMGCGKSTVGTILEKFGWRRVDADVVVRELLSNDSETYAAVVETFGNCVVKDGKLSRKRLGALVFEDVEALQKLESILHPKVRRIWEGKVASATEDGVPILVELPLLFEKGLGDHFDATVCVAAPRPIQLKRLEERGVDREEAEKRIARQLPLDEKMRMSDFVVTNSGPLAFLVRQVHLLNNDLRR